VGVVAQLAGHEHAGAVQAGSGDGLADFPLVAVHLGSVYVAVARFQRAAHRGHRLLRLDQEDAEAWLAGWLAGWLEDLSSSHWSEGAQSGVADSPSCRR
jgi:hypothetical protein